MAPTSPIATNIRPRILVILEPHSDISRLYRAAKRKATLENADWEICLIETPHLYRCLDAQANESLLSVLTLAEQMGIHVTKRYAPQTIDGIKEIISHRIEQQTPVSSIIIGDTKLKTRFPWFKKNLSKQLTHFLPPHIQVNIIPMGEESVTERGLANIIRFNWKDILFSLLTVVIATLFLEIFDYFFPRSIGTQHGNRSIVYMIACAYSAGRYGLLAGIIVSITSFLTFNLMYVAPNFSLLLNDRRDVINLILFLSTGIVLSLMNSRDFGNRLVLAKRANFFYSLLKIHRLLLNRNTPEEAISILDSELKTLFGCDVLFFLPSPNDKKILNPVLQSDIKLTENEQKILQTCWEASKTTGVGAPYNPPPCQWRFEPLATSHDEIGVLGVRITNKTKFDTDFIQLFSGIAGQVALILERMQLRQVANINKLQAERETLRSMLLSSVSHDLKTPLASIIGSLSVYRRMEKDLSEERRTILIDTAIEEAQRLDRFISNILDITRIESGQIRLKKEWVKPAELIPTLSKSLRERLKHHPVIIIPGPDNIEVSMDATMTCQVIQNLLDNAAKYTAPGTQIEISWSMDENTGFSLFVRDHGAGIPPDQLDRIFDKYARLKRKDSQVAGTGLGLAIAKAVMLLQSGSIVAANHPDGGAIFTLNLPITRPLEHTKVI